MRHKKLDTKLGRSSAHRRATVAALVCSLIEEKRIKTTLPKAKVAGSLAEKMVTLGRDGSLAARRRAISRLMRERPVRVLFDELAPRFEGRQGGYTRIVRLGQRRSDGSEMALLEWVDIAAPAKKKKKKKPAEEAK